ncbi:MAG: SCO family protein [Acidobacteriota bacterium]
MKREERKLVRSGRRALRVAWTAGLGLVMAAAVMAQAPGKITVEGVTEKLGAQVPLDAKFTDSQGREVTLGQVMTKPTVLALFYSRCAGICPRLLEGVAGVVNRMPLDPGKDYQIISISFDPTDTPQILADKKRNYMALVKRPIQPQDWLFLSGDKADIDKVTDAVGFSYQKDQDMYIHPATLIVLSPKGKVVQYLYGVSYVPSALQMAIGDAAKEKTGSRIVGELLSCFSIRPKGSVLVSRVMALSGVAVILSALAFVAFLVFTNPNRKVKHGEARSRT